MLPRHGQFIRAPQHIMNVSPATVCWHMHALKWLTSEVPTKEHPRGSRSRCQDLLPLPMFQDVHRRRSRNILTAEDEVLARMQAFDNPTSHPASF